MIIMILFKFRSNCHRSHQLRQHMCFYPFHSFSRQRIIYCLSPPQMEYAGYCRSCLYFVIMVKLWRPLIRIWMIPFTAASRGIYIRWRCRSYSLSCWWIRRNPSALRVSVHWIVRMIPSKRSVSILHSWTNQVKNADHKRMLTWGCIAFFQVLKCGYSFFMTLREI